MSLITLKLTRKEVVALLHACNMRINTMQDRPGGWGQLDQELPAIRNKLVDSFCQDKH